MAEVRSDPLAGVPAAATAATTENGDLDSEKTMHQVDDRSDSNMETSGNGGAEYQGPESGSNVAADETIVKLDEKVEEDNETAKHGFTRVEMYTEPLAGSVKLYERHVFLCYKDPSSWPPHVEAADFDRLPRHLVAALRARKNDMPKTKFTICERQSDSGSSNGDILIFPEMLKFRNLSHLDVDSFVEEVLVKGKNWIAGKSERLTGSHVFACCHASRDARCGYCGPLLIEKFKEEITMRSLNNEVSVRACSHVGGHKYAGNVIVYSPQPKGGTVTGHWYGYVTPQDVAGLLEQHICKGEIVERLWRGEMGLDEEEQKLSQNGRLQSGRCEGCTCVQSQPCGAPAVSQSMSSEDDKPRQLLEVKEPEKVEQNSEDASRGKEAPSTTPKAKSRASKGICRGNFASRLFESWEMEDTLVVAALIGAALSVTLAYHFYRKSS